MTDGCDATQGPHTAVTAGTAASGLVLVFIIVIVLGLLRVVLLTVFG